VGVKVGVLVAVEVGVAVGRAVAVAVGAGVNVRVAVGRVVLVAVGAGVRVCVGGGVFVRVALGMGVRLGAVSVGVGRCVRLGGGSGLAVEVVAGVSVAAGLGVTVGGSPSRTKRPEALQSVPTKTWTSYWPGVHSGAGRSQLATATPGGKSCQDVVSTYLSSPFWYQSAVHSTFTPTGWYVKTEYICLIGFLNSSPGAIRV